MSSGNQMLIVCASQMQDLAQTHPDWWADYEDAQVDIGCERAVLEDLLATAPTPFAQGVIYGKMMFRQQVAALTERAF